MGVTRGRHGAYVAPLRAALIVVGVILAICVLAAVWFVRAPLPKLNGSIAAPGLAAEVIIRRDDRGIPHVSAPSEAAAFFGQGFACAQDRLWQMDIYRREAEGRLSEIFGPVALPTDEYFRTIGLAGVARRDAAIAGPQMQAILDAYADGVNLAASTHPLPVEFRLLNYRPEPWTPVDTYAAGLLITHSQDDYWHEAAQLRADLANAVGVHAATALMDAQVPSLEEYLPEYARRAVGAASRPDANGQPSPIAWSTTPGVTPPSFADRQGSNNWAVAGVRTTTGKPVLSNDTHLDHSLPSTWWISQVDGGVLDVEGFTLPGVPGVIIGHNRRIAWGVTSASEDAEDLFVERFASAKSDRYLADGTWVRATHRAERIKVKGHADVVLDVLVTRHGPVVKRSGATGLALSWIALREPGNTDFVVRIDHAGNWREFRSALRDFIGPTLNFAYADVDGHIGYQDAGRVPERAAGDGSMPAEGQDDRFAWTGDVPFDTLPREFDPQRGFLATANNAVVPPTFAPALSRDYLAPFRVHEIVSRLSAPGRRTPQAIGALQSDDFDYASLRLAAIVAPVLAASRQPGDRELATLLAGWNGHADVDATPPTFLHALDLALEDRLLKPKVPTHVYADYVKHHHLLTPIMRVLDGDRSLASMSITRATVLAALLPAAHDAESKLGYPGRALGSWGVANAAVYDHPLAIGWPLTLLNAPAIPQPGDGYTVFQSRPDFGPSMRFVGDLSDWDDSSMLLTLGESGVWTSPHYDDMEQDWVDVAWRPTPFSDAAVVNAAVDTLRLEPAAR